MVPVILLLLKGKFYSGESAVDGSAVEAAAGDSAAGEVVVEAATDQFAVEKLLLTTLLWLNVSLESSRRLS